MSLLLKHVSRGYVRTRQFSSVNSFKRFASQTAAASSNESNETNVEKKEEKLELDLKKFSLSPRLVAKQPALPPLIKEMFLGEIDEKYFPFLEVIEKEHVDKYFKERRAKAQEFLSQMEDGEKIIQNLKSFGNLGFSVPQVYNGSGFDITELTLHTEIEANNLKVNSVLNSHRMVIQAIMEHGTEEQRSRYLPKLANGEIIGTVAIFERESAPDDRPFHTIATPTNTGFKLNGEKDFVINAEKSNLFLVISSSIRQDHAKKQTLGVSAFLVEDNEPGILKSEPFTTIGCDEVEKNTVTFANVPVRAENVLGEVNQVQNIAIQLIQLGRLQAALTSCQLMKRIINNFAKYCIETKIMGGFPK